MRALPPGTPPLPPSWCLARPSVASKHQMLCHQYTGCHSYHCLYDAASIHHHCRYAAGWTLLKPAAQRLTDAAGWTRQMLRLKRSQESENIVRVLAVADFASFRLRPVHFAPAYSSYAVRHHRQGAARFAPLAGQMSCSLITNGARQDLYRFLTGQMIYFFRLPVLPRRGVTNCALVRSLARRSRSSSMILHRL